jgi:hypothetical protein
MDVPRLTRAIIKKDRDCRSKSPESFNVLVKELQGLGLKVDLVASDTIVDAENVLATNIHEEATHPVPESKRQLRLSQKLMSPKKKQPGEGFEFEDSDGNPVENDFVARHADDDDDDTTTDH